MVVRGAVCRGDRAAGPERAQAGIRLHHGGERRGRGRQRYALRHALVQWLPRQRNVRHHRRPAPHKVSCLLRANPRSRFGREHCLTRGVDAPVVLSPDNVWIPASLLATGLGNGHRGFASVYRAPSVSERVHSPKRLSTLSRRPGGCLTFLGALAKERRGSESGRNPSAGQRPTPHGQ